MKYNFLYLSPFSPAAKHGGGALLRNLLDEEIRKEIVWYSLCDTNNKYHNMKIYPSGILMRIFHSIRFAKLRRRFNFLFIFIEKYFIGKKILSIINKHYIKKVVFYSNPNFYHIYKYVILNSDIKFHFTIHDDPINANKLHGSHRLNEDDLKKDFQFILKNCQSADVISNEMLSKYSPLTDAKIEVIQKGKRYEDSKLKDPKIGVKINIFSAGNAWTTELEDLKDDSVKYFLSGLELINNETNSFDFFITTPFFPYENQYDFVHRYNYLSNEEFSKLISKTHIGYSYDPLTENLREFAKLSFPSKLIDYIVNQIPFIYHGPEDSTVTNFLKIYKCGEVIESKSPQTLSEVTLRIVKNYESYTKEALRAWKEVFDQQVINSKFKDLLNKNL